MSKNQKNTPIGVEGLGRIVDVFQRRKRGFPACAIAGITAANAAPTIAAGADGVSVISALSLAPDPEAAARTLRSVVDQALATRPRS
jgi:thiamine-phosphate pyrophosphorylase